MMTTSTPVSPQAPCAKSLQSASDVKAANQDRFEDRSGSSSEPPDSIAHRAVSQMAKTNEDLQRDNERLRDENLELSIINSQNHERLKTYQLTVLNFIKDIEDIESNERNFEIDLIHKDYHDELSRIIGKFSYRSNMTEIKKSVSAYSKSTQTENDQIDIDGLKEKNKELKKQLKKLSSIGIHLAKDGHRTLQEAIKSGKELETTYRELHKCQNKADFQRVTENLKTKLDDGIKEEDLQDKQQRKSSKFPDGILAFITDRAKIDPKDLYCEGFTQT